MGAAVVVMAGVTIAYGESWLLRSAPAGSIEFAASDGLARVLDRELSVNCCTEAPWKSIEREPRT